MTLTIESGMDFSKIGTMTIDINEDGGGNQTITISTGKYFHLATAAAATGPHPAMVSDYLSLATKIQDEWDGFASQSPTVTFDRTTGLYTFADGALTTLVITLNSVAQNVLGMAASLTGALTYTSTVIPYYWLAPAHECRGAPDTRPYFGENDLAKDVYAHDGSAASLAKDAAPMWWDWSSLGEPYAEVWKIEAAAGAPWTWEHFYEHQANVEPFAVYDGTNTDFHRLRADGVKFQPRQQTMGYYAVTDQQLRTQYLGRV